MEAVPTYAELLARLDALTSATFMVWIPCKVPAEEKRLRALYDALVAVRERIKTKPESETGVCAELELKEDVTA